MRCRAERCRAASAGRDRHGSRRSRQDLAARLHPPHQGGGRRGRRHHAAHRRLSRGDAARASITFLDTPGPRGVHRHARARRARPPTSWCWWWRPTTASCRRPSRPSSMRAPPNVPIVVAVNKIDKPRRRSGSRAHRTCQVRRDPGGVGRRRTCSCKVSARTGAGHRSAARGHPAAGRSARAQGAARRPGLGHRHRVQHREGPRRGRDRAGQARHAASWAMPILAGTEFGRVRAMFDETGQPVRRRCPSMPVVVLGLSGAPNAGDELLAVESERKAREVALYRQGKFRDVKLARSGHACRGRVLADGRGQGRHHRRADQGRRAGQRRGAARCAEQALDRRSAGARSSPAASAASPSPTCSWPPPPRRASSASTCAPMRPRARRSRKPASKCATTASFTKPSMT